MFHNGKVDGMKIGKMNEKFSMSIDCKRCRFPIVRGNLLIKI